MDRVDIEDIYPLSPMQQGLFFHSLYAPDSGVYVEQVVWAFSGDFDVAAFKAAWERIVARHTILRTAFIWEGMPEPVQVVLRRVALQWEEHDWRTLPTARQQQQIDAYLKSRRQEGFPPSEAPLMRFGLLRTADDSYQFVWSFHHILLDGWSMPVLTQELFACYNAICSGREPHLPAAQPYRDYIAWLQCQSIADAEAFWRSTLRGFTTPTTLGIGRITVRAARQEEGFASEQVWLSTELTAKLNALSRGHHFTLNALVQGAWALLLSRYTGQSDVVFGFAVSGRPPELRGVETMVGLFINTLPARVRVRDKARLLEWLAEIQEGQIAAAEYAYTPLVQIQGWSDVPRGQALFESLLGFENAPTAGGKRSPKNSEQEGQGEQDGLEVRQVDSWSQTSYPLNLVVVPGQSLKLQITYARDHFERGTITGILRHIESLLAAMAANPSARLGELSFFSDSDRRQMLEDSKANAADYPKDVTIHELVERQAKSTPEAVAIVAGGQALTYRALNSRANQLARRLRALGVGAETRVGVYLERSPELVLALLGILKAGGCYVPLDPSDPSERLAFMLIDAEAPIALTRRQLVARLGEYQGWVTCLDSDWGAIAQERADDLPANVTADNLAYVIYTSGSTGKPKGVEVVHRSAINLITWHQSTYDVKPSDRASLVASPAFDASVWELWPYLTSGATILIPDEETRASPLRLVDWMAAERITICFLPTPVVALLLDGQWPPNLVLRALLTGGDRLPQRPQHQPLFDIVNHYGPTENTVVTTAAHVADSAEHSALPAIGKAIRNVQVYVLDPQMEPVPTGLPGELFIGGENLARGYLLRPSLTAQRFLPNPFSTQQGARMYRTGDLARYLPDGNLQFLGRTDQQVKIRGYRIELGEVEAALNGHPAVAEAVVLAREDTPADKRLVAYVVPKGSGDNLSAIGENGGNGLTPTGEQAWQLGRGHLASELLSYLHDKLPDYMIPTAYVLLDGLPLTPNGKVDRRALPPPEAGAQGQSEHYVAPRTRTEEAMAALWAGLLGVEGLGVENDFFMLGGHSLLAVQLIFAIQDTFGVELPLRNLFDTPTVRGLAQLIDELVKSDQTLQTPVIVPAPRTRYRADAPAQ